MSKQPYRIEGNFQMGRVRQHFVLEFPAADEAEARAHAFADLGSRHGVKRRQIDIQSVQTVDADDADAITRKRLGE